MVKWAWFLMVFSLNLVLVYPFLFPSHMAKFNDFCVIGSRRYHIRKIVHWDQFRLHSSLLFYFLLKSPANSGRTFRPKRIRANFSKTCRKWSTTHEEDRQVV